jgi:hypothetical protein
VLPSVLGQAMHVRWLAKAAAPSASHIDLFRYAGFCAAGGQRCTSFVPADPNTPPSGVREPGVPPPLPQP